MFLVLLFSSLTGFLQGITNHAHAQSKLDSVKFLSFLRAEGHTPAKAAFFAAVLPGAGQIYNRKFWKTPIAYAGYGAGGFFLASNQINYKTSKKDYIALTDTLEETYYEGGLSAGQLLINISSYRRSRDLAVLVILAWHALCILDANVDAHLMTWDVNDDLSLRMSPVIFENRRSSPVFGLNLALLFR